VRFVWNKFVENFNNYDKNNSVYINEQTLKHNPEFSFLKDVSNCSLHEKMRDFERTKTQFFNPKRKVRLGRMKFKKRGVSNDSFRLTSERFRIDYENSLVRLEKIGFVKIVLDRPIPDGVKVNSITISKTKTNKFFVSIQFDTEHVPSEPTGKRIGLDLGLTHFITTSEGGKYDNPKFFRENQAKLATNQKHLSRKQKGSNRYLKQKLKVARIHEKIKNSRNHFQHELSKHLVSEYDIICIEDLNVKGMAKNRKLAKSISDAGWSEFIRKLEYKASWNEKFVVKVNRFFPSSKTCSGCGTVVESLSLSVREWVCTECGMIHDRDVNAAINILNKGYFDLTGVPLSAESVDYRRGEDVRRCYSDANLVEASIK